MANINVTIRMDEDPKKEAEALIDELGMSLSTAVNMFVRQAVRVRSGFFVRRRSSWLYPRPGKAAAGITPRRVSLPTPRSA